MNPFINRSRLTPLSDEKLADVSGGNDDNGPGEQRVEKVDVEQYGDVYFADLVGWVYE